MKRSKILLLFAFGLGAYLFFSQNGRNPDQPLLSGIKVQQNGSGVSRGQIAAPTPGRLGSEGVVDFLRDNYKSKVTQKIAEFLKANNNSASALFAAWLLGGDEKSGLRLKDMASTDPAACQAILAFNDGSMSKADMLALVAKCRMANPNVGSLDVLHAGLCADQGNLSETVQILRDFKYSGKNDLGFVGRLRSTRELLLLSGVKLTEAWQQSYTVNSQTMAEMGSFIGKIQKPVKAAMSGLTEIEKINLASQAVAVSSSLWDGKNVISIYDHQMSVLELQALSGLPQDVEYGSTGETVFDRKIDLQKISKMLDYNNNELIPFLLSSDDSTITAFVQRYESTGVNDALTWLGSIKKSRE